MCVWKYWWNILFPLSSFRMKVSSPKQKGLTDYEKGMSVLTRTKSMERNIKENNSAQWVINVNCHFSKNQLCSLNSEWLKYKTHKSFQILKRKVNFFSGMYRYIKFKHSWSIFVKILVYFLFMWLSFLMCAFSL